MLKSVNMHQSKLTFKTKTYSYTSQNPWVWNLLQWGLISIPLREGVMFRCITVHFKEFLKFLKFRSKYDFLELLNAMLPDALVVRSKLLCKKVQNQSHSVASFKRGKKTMILMPSSIQWQKSKNYRNCTFCMNFFLHFNKYSENIQLGLILSSNSLYS